MDINELLKDRGINEPGQYKVVTQDFLEVKVAEVLNQMGVNPQRVSLYHIQTSVTDDVRVQVEIYLRPMTTAHETDFYLATTLYFSLAEIIAFQNTQIIKEEPNGTTTP